MELLIMDTDGISCMANQIGCVMEGTFLIAEECVDCLEQLIGLVEKDGPGRYHARRMLGVLEVLPKTLLPLLQHLDSEENEEFETQKIFRLTTKLIMYLTQPMESIVFPTQPLQKHEHMVQMQEHLWQYKNAFLEKSTLPSFFTQIQALLSEAKDGQLPDADCEAINHFLLVVRNILFISPLEVLDSKYADIILLSLLFQGGLADLVIRLSLMDQHIVWCAAVVQVLSLVYKNKGTESKNKKLSSPGVTWLQTNVHSELTTTENLHPCTDLHSPTSALTTPRSLDEAVLSPMSSPAMPCPPSPPTPPFPAEGTQSSGSPPVSPSESESWARYLNELNLEEQSNSPTGASTGGNEADRSYSSEDKLDENVAVSLMQIETKLCLTLNEFKVRQELMMFTYTMLQQGIFNNLIEDLNTILTLDKQRLPDVYFMWLVVHFLRVAQKGEVQFEKIRSCLSVDIVTYLTYIGVVSLEDLVQSSGPASVFTMRRYHLVILALQEVINSIHHIRRHEQTPAQRAHIDQLSEFLVEMHDLRNLLLVTIRHYRPTSSNLAFLRDAVVLNHNFLSLAENVLNCPDIDQTRKFNMLEHVKGFATMEVMGRYGLLLENYLSNTPLINDCIFTIMHHVVGDCGAPHTLMQDNILRAFSDIWDDNHNLPQECQDLIHFILDSFITHADSNPYECANYLFGESETSESLSNKERDAEQSSGQESGAGEMQPWSQQDCDDLFMVYQDHADRPLSEALHPILIDLADKGIIKSECEVLLQLYQQNLCTDDEIIAHSEARNGSTETSMDCTTAPSKSSSEDQEMTDGSSTDTAGYQQLVADLKAVDANVDDLVRIIKENNQEDMLVWVQTVLLETCYVKIGGRKLASGKYPEEPVPLHFTLQNKSVPIVPYTERQEVMLKDHVFMFLMEKLGLHFPEDSGGAFPRIPHFWTPADLMAAAKKLSDIDFAGQKFSESEVTEYIHEQLLEVHKALMIDTPSDVPVENVEQMGNLWNTFIQQCNINMARTSVAPQN